MKTLAIDFDDTLCETTHAFFEFNKEKYNCDAVYDSADLSLYKTLEISEDEENRRWNEFFNLTEFSFPPPVKGLAETLHSIKNDYKLVILTARSKAWQSQIPIWIDKYMANIFDEIIFTENLGWKDTMKGIVCKNMNIDVLVDDEPKQIESCLKSGVKVFVFDRPWNRNISSEVVRITTMSEIIGQLN